MDKEPCPKHQLAKSSDAFTLSSTSLPQSWRGVLHFGCDRDRRHNVHGCARDRIKVIIDIIVVVFIAVAGPSEAGSHSSGKFESARELKAGEVAAGTTPIQETMNQ